MERLESARDPERFRPLGHAVVDRLGDYLAAAGERAIPVSRPVATEGMAERWPADFPGGADPLALVERVLAESVVTHHPGYVGHQLAAPLPLASLGTLVTAVTNGSGAIYELSQSSTACEAALARHLAERLGLPATAGGMIVHGGTIATLTALLAARQAQAGFDVWRDGAQAGPPLALLTSDQTHYSTSRAAQIMGFGDAGAIAVETDERFRMRPAALTAEIAAARDARISPDRRRRDRGHDVHGRIRPARRDRRHLRRRGAVAARRRRARRLGRAEPGARTPTRGHRPSRLGGVGSAQDPAVPGARLAPRVRARAGCVWGIRAEGRLSLRRRPGRGEHGHAHARVHAPAARRRGLPRIRGRRDGRHGGARRAPLGARRPARRAGARERRLRARARARVQHRVLPAPRAGQAPIPTRTRSASRARSTRAGATTSCRRGCAARPGCAAR